MESESQLPKLFVPRKYERDVDMLLAEEFSASAEFGVWFLEQTTQFKGVEARTVQVEVSVADNLGESDLIVTFKRVDTGSLFALLIEDKIDAPVMPNQIDRYRLRAARYQRQGLFEQYEIVLCSPETYVKTHPEMTVCDSMVSYESIAKDYFESVCAHSPRAAYRAGFLRQAAGKASHGSFTQIRDVATDLFWNETYKIANFEFPELEMKEPRFTIGQSWIDFRPLEMKSGIVRPILSLKAGLGCADLTFSRTLVRIFQPAIRHLLEEDMTVHQTGAASAVRLKFSGFQVSPWDAVVEERVRQALQACTRLVRFYRTHQAKLQEAALQASSPFAQSQVELANAPLAMNSAL